MKISETILDTWTNLFQVCVEVLPKEADTEIPEIEEFNSLVTDTLDTTIDTIIKSQQGVMLFTLLFIMKSGKYNGLKYDKNTRPLLFRNGVKVEYRDIYLEHRNLLKKVESIYQAMESIAGMHTEYNRRFLTIELGYELEYKFYMIHFDDTLNDFLRWEHMNFCNESLKLD